jgi:hypothetical protein
MAHNKSAKIVSVEATVNSSPIEIFELLADPRKHHLFDGSGSVKDADIQAPSRLSLGAKFGMNMKIGVPYKLTNEVVEFVEGSRIGWRHIGGHVWRYILEPTAGGTKITEQFDYSTSKSPMMLTIMKAIPRNEQSIIKTLKNIEQHFSSPQ